MVPLEPPTPDLTFDRRRARSERMDSKRARNARTKLAGVAPIPRHVLEFILQDPASVIATYSAEFKSLILQSFLHYGISTFYESWNCGYAKQEGNP